MPGSAWPSRDQPLVQPATWQTLTWRNTLVFQLERESDHSVALLSYRNVCINLKQTLGESTKTKMNFQAETSDAKL